MKLIPYGFVLFCLGLLAACSGGSDAQNSPQLTEPQAQEALEDLLDDVMKLAPDPQNDASLAAFGALSAPDLAELGAEEGRLPRGLYRYSPGTGEYVFVDSSDDLIVAWLYTDPDGREATAGLGFDWNADGETIQAAVPGTGERQEMPTGLNFKMSAADEIVADLNAKLTYDPIPGCGVTVEPSSLEVDGGGSLATLSNVGYRVTDSGVTAQGALTVADGALGFAWQVRAEGRVARDTCAPVGFTAQSGEASFTLSVQNERYTLSFGVGNVDAATGSATLTNGAFISKGRTAVTFAGTLDDRNDDGIPGDSLTVTFKGGQTATLEQLLRGSDMLNLALRTLRR